MQRLTTPYARTPSSKLIWQCPPGSTHPYDYEAAFTQTMDAVLHAHSFAKACDVVILSFEDNEGKVKPEGATVDHANLFFMWEQMLTVVSKLDDLCTELNNAACAAERGVATL